MIKKIVFLGLVLGMIAPVTMLAQSDNTGTSEKGAPDTMLTSISYDGTCASNAVIAHENTEESIIEARQASMKDAATTRRDALAAAYLLTDETSRNAGIKAAQDAFLTAQKATDKTAMSASKTENQSFKSTMEGCGAPLPPPTRDEVQNQYGGDTSGRQNKFYNLGMPSGVQYGHGMGGKIEGNTQGGSGQSLGRPQSIQGDESGPRMTPNQNDGQMPPPPMSGAPNINQGGNGQSTQQTQPQAQSRPWWRFW